MTSSAIKLAIECGATFYQDQAICMGHNSIKTFYAKAQAQAIRDAYVKADCADDLLLMADELEKTK